jgi:hypothetical protein
MTTHDRLYVTTRLLRVEPTFRSAINSASDLGGGAGAAAAGVSGCFKEAAAPVIHEPTWNMHSSPAVATPIASVAAHSTGRG